MALVVAAAATSAEAVMLEDFESYTDGDALGLYNSGATVNGWISWNLSYPAGAVKKLGDSLAASGNYNSQSYVFCNDRASDFSGIVSDGTVGTVDIEFSADMRYTGYYGTEVMAVGFSNDTDGYLRSSYTTTEFAPMFGINKGNYYIRKAGYGAIVEGGSVVYDISSSAKLASVSLRIAIDMDANGGDGAGWLYDDDDGGALVLGGTDGINLSLSSGPAMNSLTGLALILKGNSDNNSWARGYTDNISMTVIPEPTTLCLLAGGVLGLIRRRRLNLA
jgi:hypothetical protein